MITCDLSTLESESACIQCLSKPELEAALVYILAVTLAGLGGADVTSATDLQSASACFACKDEKSLLAMKVQIAIQVAINTNVLATAPTASEIRAAVQPYLQMGAKGIMAAEVYTTCGVAQLLGVPPAT